MQHFINPKFLLMLICGVLLTLCSKAYSKDKEGNVTMSRVRNYYMYSYSNEWQLNASVGPQVYFGEHDFRYGIFNRITPAFSLGLHKQISEYWGCRFKISGGFQCDAVPNRSTQGNFYFTTKNFTTVGFSGDLMLDLNRFFTSKTYNNVPQFWGFAGVGVDVVSGTSNGNDGEHPIFNMGMLSQFPVSERIDISAEIKGVMVPDQYDGAGTGWPVEGFLTTLIGVTYHF